jgi:hypothetical protein
MLVLVVTINMVEVAVVALTLALRVAEVLEVVVEEVNTATILLL